MAFRYRVTFKGDDLGILDMDEVTMDEALQLEDQTGMSVDELVKNLARSSARAVQATVWFQALRVGKPMDLHQNFKFGDFDVNKVDEEDPTEAAEAIVEAARRSELAGTSTSGS